MGGLSRSSPRRRVAPDKPRSSLVGGGWIVAVASLCAACQQTHVAGIVQTSVEATETAGATQDSTATTSDPTRADTEGSSGAVECELPSPLPRCDAAEDPLRALEVACYQDVTAAAFNSRDPDAWRSAHEFGNAFWTSPDSNAVLAITTGRFPEVHPSGQVALLSSAAQPGSANDNPDDASAPPPVDTVPGSNAGAGGSPFFGCDGQGDCSDTLPDAWPAGSAHDLLSFAFDVRVPAQAHGYSVRVAILTAEFPERVGDPNSDAFVWWVSSESYTGNLATLGTAPATVTGLAPRLTIVGDAPALLRTGMDGTQPQACTWGSQAYDRCPIGAATPWLELAGPAIPGETLSIVAAVFDRGSDELDTTVLLDGWRWRCEGCTPGVDCGLRSP